MKSKSKIPVMYMLVCVYVIFSAFDLLEKSEVTLAQKASYIFLILIPLGLSVLTVWQRNTRLERRALPATAMYFPLGAASVLFGAGLLFGVEGAVATGIPALLLAAVGINRIRNLAAAATLVSIDLPPAEARKIERRLPYERFPKFALLPVAGPDGGAPAAGEAAHLLISRDPRLFDRMKERRELAEQSGEGPKELPAFCKDHDRRWCGVALNPIAVAINPQAWKKALGADPEPLRSLETLLSPNVSGSFVLPDPEHSDAGFLFLAGLVQRLGETEGLRFMADLKSRASRMARDPIDARRIFSDPEQIAAVGFLHDFLAADGMRLRLVVGVPEGSPWEMFMAGIPERNNPSLEQAGAFLDSLADRTGNEVFAGKALLLPAHPRALVPPGCPPAEAVAVNQDFDMRRALAGRDDLLRKWREQSPPASREK